MNAKPTPKIGEEISIDGKRYKYALGKCKDCAFKLKAMECLSWNCSEDDGIFVLLVDPDGQGAFRF